MKSLYKILFVLAITLGSFQIGQAQTYVLDGAGWTNCGGPGIFGPINCEVYTGIPALLDSFVDVNAPGALLNTMDIVVYTICTDSFNLYLNGVLVTTDQGDQSVICTCGEDTTTNPLVRYPLSFALTPAIQAAYVSGGVNTFTFEATGTTVNGGVCMYGAEVTVSVGPATPVPTVSEWALIFLGCSFLLFGVFMIKRLI